MKKKTARILLLTEIVAILTLLFVFRGHLLALLFPGNAVMEQHAAPELMPGTWINSEPLTIGGLRGNVVLLDFWTFKCGPCLAVVPTLEQWHKKYPALALIGVHSPETKEEASVDNLRRRVGLLNISYPIVTDNGMSSWTRYKAEVWPTLYLIDKKGVIRDIHRGRVGLDGVEKKIEELLAE